MNQTVFQLRRLLDPSYRGGESPEYVISTSEQVGLNPELCYADILEVHRLNQKTLHADWDRRQRTVDRVLDLIRGEFLSDLRYEQWASRLQRSVHTEVRRVLLPVAKGGPETFESAISIRAASVLLQLDPFDESAVLALATALARTGRRVAARQVVVEFVQQMRVEYDDEPSAAFVRAAGDLGATLDVNPSLTKVRPAPLRD